MDRESKMWDDVKKSYRVCYAEPAAESIALELIEKYPEFFELDGIGAEVPLPGWTYALGMSPVVVFIVAVTLATKEAKDMNMTDKEYLVALQNRLMDKRLYKPR